MNDCKFSLLLVLSSVLVLVSLPASAANYNVAVGPNGDIRFDPKNLTISREAAARELPERSTWRVWVRYQQAVALNQHTDKE
jgi:hypothetical protein